MDVTFDTNVLLSSTLWAGSVAQKLLSQFIRADVKIYSSEEILTEYQKVLKRDFDYSDDEISNIIEKVLSFITLVVPTRKAYVVKDDPDDNKIIECALESSSKYIITYDKHLLSIDEYKGIKIIRPEDITIL
ncbi:MAG: putative toxin-antitoxin system toxin component, PIN family [archaeon]